MGDINIGSIKSAFECTGTNPVRIRGAGNYMDALKNIFEEKTNSLQAAPGLPAGVYVANPQPEQTLATLNITSMSSSV
jgi:hypothetical protein